MYWLHIDTRYYWFWNNKCDKVFKNGSSKIYGRQPLKNMNGYGHDGLLKQTTSLQIF